MLDLNVFANRLKEARSRKNMSQAELAKAIGVATGTISVYENPNGNRCPAFDKTVAIAETLEISIDWLCGLETETPKALDGLELLNTLLEIIEVLDMRAFVTNDYEYGFQGRLNMICDDNRIAEFYHEYEKIRPILNDETLADYLKDGLRKALFEKFKDFKVSP